MNAPVKYRNPVLFPTWFRHPKAAVSWPKGLPDPEDTPDVRCPSCGADLIDYDDESAVAAGFPSCRDLEAVVVTDSPPTSSPVPEEFVMLHRDRELEDRLPFVEVAGQAAAIRVVIDGLVPAPRPSRSARMQAEWDAFLLSQAVSR